MSAHHSLDDERAVLGCIALDEGAYDEVGDVLSADDFYSRANGTIYQAMARLRARSEPIDDLTLRAELQATGELARAGGDEALLRLTSTIPNVAAVESYARTVAKHATVRAMVRAASGIVGRAREPVEDADAFLDASERDLQAVATRRRTDRRGAPMRDIVISVTESLTERAKSGGVHGLRTGIAALDRMLGGMKGGQLIIVAGRPGMGKSALAGCVARHVARTDPAAIFSLEMSKDEWGERLVIAESRVDGDTVKSGQLSRSDWARWTTAAGALSDVPIHVDDTPALTIWALRSKARRLKAQGKLAFVAVDYLQLMTGDERDREKEVAAISRGLKALAKELEVPVMALSQLNRSVETTKDKRPTMAHLRESGQIEQDADAILFVYRPGFYFPESFSAHEAEIIVGKQRSGATGRVKCRFIREHYRFEGVDDEDRYGAGPDLSAPLVDPDEFADPPSWHG